MPDYNPIESILQRALREKMLGINASGASMQEPPVGVRDPTIKPNRSNYIDPNPQGYDERNKVQGLKDQFEAMSPATLETKVVSFGASKAKLLSDKLTSYVGMKQTLRDIGKTITTKSGDTKEAINRINQGLEKIKPRLDPRVGTPEFEKLGLKEKQLALGRNAFDDYTTYNEMKDALQMHNKAYKQSTQEYNQLLEVWRSNETQISKLQEDLKQIKK